MAKGDEALKGRLAERVDALEKRMERLKAFVKSFVAESLQPTEGREEETFRRCSHIGGSK